MEKKLTYKEKVKIQNNLTSIKAELANLLFIKDAIVEYINEIHDILNESENLKDLISKEELLHQSRRVRNYSKPEDVYYAVPTSFIENQDENTKD